MKKELNDDVVVETIKENRNNTACIVDMCYTLVEFNYFKEHDMLSKGYDPIIVRTEPILEFPIEGVGMGSCVCGQEIEFEREAVEPIVNCSSCTEVMVVKKDAGYYGAVYLIEDKGKYEIVKKAIKLEGELLTEKMEQI